MQQSALHQFFERHQLPAQYIDTIDNYARPIAQALAKKRQNDAHPLIVGVNGSQGSGKTTLSDALVTLWNTEFELNTVAISIDDFYLTKAERQKLAADVHPLLLTRGVPGTHDIRLALDTLRALTKSSRNVAIPRFDKAQDDRAPQHQWDSRHAPVDIVILEGWCVGSEAQPMSSLVDPVNALEEKEDPEGNWRHYVNAQLQLGYRELFRLLDVKIMLQAPSFECVYNWRVEQEEKLKQKSTGKGLMSREEIQRFVQHYQRITENTLQTLPAHVNFLLELDRQRKIINFSSPDPLSNAL
ncbi:kinase [Aestuariicella sp. G3-2]|uniref:kinase n=1 Tax=Pseudomaricurvus albidus TaxID=2842452 RepID=UPI001C0CA0F0|nr:kinase [Aestuariicella albida]MBU3071092.1 kinase [Aestuariicella albida]